MDAQAEPFRSAEAAWFWASGFLAARREGAGAAFGTGGNRPCEPDDIVQLIERLYRQRKINLSDARVLREWGDKGRAPDRGHRDWNSWNHTMRTLELSLRNRGIVA